MQPLHGPKPLLQVKRWLASRRNIKSGFLTLALTMAECGFPMPRDNMSVYTEREQKQPNASGGKFGSDAQRQVGSSRSPLHSSFSEPSFLDHDY